MSHHAVWPARLPALARMTKAGRSRQQIADAFEVSKATIDAVRRRYAQELKALMAERAVSPLPSVEPTIVLDDEGRTIKRYPTLWAEDAVFEPYTAKPKGRVKRVE